MKFTAIDFETANYSNASICAAGIAVFESGLLKQSCYWLIRPPKGHGFFRPDFTECHGLTWFDVQNAPEFPAIAPDFLHLLTTADFVIAHNAPFDLRKLHGTLAHFGLPCPPFDCRCTMQLARRVWPDLPSHSLDALAAHIHHKFQHHNAQADAEAAGCIMTAITKQMGRAASPSQLAEMLDFRLETTADNGAWPTGMPYNGRLEARANDDPEAR